MCVMKVVVIKEQKKRYNLTTNQHDIVCNIVWIILTPVLIDFYFENFYLNGDILPPKEIEHKENKKIKNTFDYWKDIQYF